MQKNIVFLGSKKIGYECLSFLQKNTSKLKINIIGVLTNDKGNEIREFAYQHNLNVISTLDDYLELDNDVHIAISVQYHLILKKEHLAKAKEININLHMAPLPEYRGCNQFSFAILEQKKEFGATLHKMETYADSGAIIAEKRFPVPDHCWVEDLYRITEENSILLFKENIHRIIDGRYTLVPQSELINKRGTSTHKRWEIEQIKQIDPTWPQDRVDRHIRATSMPGFEPPYTVVNGKKHYIRKTQ